MVVVNVLLGLYVVADLAYWLWQAVSIRRTRRGVPMLRDLAGCRGLAAGQATMTLHTTIMA